MFGILYQQAHIDMRLITDQDPQQFVGKGSEYLLNELRKELKLIYIYIKTNSMTRN